MIVHITPHHLTLSNALNTFATRKISTLGEMVHEIVAAHVVLRVDPKTNPERRFSASVRLAVRGSDVFAREVGGDLYAVIDRVVDKLMGSLRKRKSLLRPRHRSGREDRKRQLVTA